MLEHLLKRSFSHNDAPTQSDSSCGAGSEPRRHAHERGSLYEPRADVTHANIMERLMKEKMAETGVALCLDVHGDEALPYNFIAGPDGVADLAPHILPTRDAYSEALERACPDFQRVHGYPKAEPGKGNMTMCTNQVAHAFGAVSMTLEQPFKDNANRPDPDAGWSPARCALLGRAQLDALAAVLEALPEPAART